MGLNYFACTICTEIINEGYEKFGQCNNCNCVMCDPCLQNSIAKYGSIDFNEPKRCDSCTNPSAEMLLKYLLNKLNIKHEDLMNEYFSLKINS